MPPESSLFQNWWPELLQISLTERRSKSSHQSIAQLLVTITHKNVMPRNEHDESDVPEQQRDEQDYPIPRQDAALLTILPGITLASWQVQNTVASYCPLKLLILFFISCCKDFSSHSDLNHFSLDPFQDLIFILLILRIDNCKWPTLYISGYIPWMNENSRARVANSPTYGDWAGRERDHVCKGRWPGTIQTCEVGTLVIWRTQPHLKGQLLLSFRSPLIRKNQAQCCSVFWFLKRSQKCAYLLEISSLKCWPLIFKVLIHYVGPKKIHL